MSGGCGKGDMMKDALDIDWAEATAYEMTGALRFSGVLADDDYQSEQTARLEIAATLRRRCVPIERVAELEAQLASIAELITSPHDVLPTDVYGAVRQWRDDNEAVLGEMVAELEAGQGWRDPNDQPQSGPVQIILDAQMVDFFFYVPDANGRMLFNDSIVAWRPVPPQ